MFSEKNIPLNCWINDYIGLHVKHIYLDLQDKSFRSLIKILSRFNLHQKNKSPYESRHIIVDEFDYTFIAITQIKSHHESHDRSIALVNFESTFTKTFN